MPLEALVKFYIGQGLRQDLAKLFSDRVLETTAQVLARHIQSEEEISTIIQEICFETARSRSLDQVLQQWLKQAVFGVQTRAITLSSRF
jgi:hypothetical protein